MGKATSADRSETSLFGNGATKVTFIAAGHVAELVGIEGGVVSGVINLESSGV